MPSIEARLKAANAALDDSSPRSDRKSTDAIFLTTSDLTAELSRVNSTPLSSQGVDARILQSSTSSTVDEPSPLTMAPPKPGPADTLYPSPSGGFVPSPEEGQDWRLKPPPQGRNTKDNSTTSSAPSFTAVSTLASSSPPSSSSRALPSLSEDVRQPSSSLSPTLKSNTSTPTRPPSLPSSHQTAAKIANASSNPGSRRSSQASNSVTSPQLRPASTSSSSRHRLSTMSTMPTADETEQRAAEQSSSRNSAALQQDESTSQASAKSTRPNSSASYQTAKVGQDSSSSCINVRDFAYPSEDPRHFGEPLPDILQSPDDTQGDAQYQDPDSAEHDEFYIDDDETEFDGHSGDSNVPPGLYKVLYQFDPVSEHELAVQPGEIVHVVGSLEGGWAIAVKDGDEERKGLVPATYLEWSGPLPQ